jgi:hypothetical protein
MFLALVGRMNSNPKKLEENQTQLASYDRALRAVGQGLESLDVADFDLEAEGNGYFALGKPSAPPKQEEEAKTLNESGLRSALQGAWQSLASRIAINGKASDSMPPVLRVLFTPEGIDRLEREGRAKRRSDSTGIPNLNRLSQILRIIGEYMNRKSGRLLKVYKRQDWIAFEYETALDGRIRENWKISDLYDFWLQLSNDRKNRYEIAEGTLSPEYDKV